MIETVLIRSVFNVRCCIKIRKFNTLSDEEGKERLRFFSFQLEVFDLC